MSQITKNALAASLKRLLEQKPLSKITVSDITNDCGVSRHTFYYHFQDVYDLMEWIFKSEASKALGGNISYDSWQRGLLNVFQYILDNKAFVLNTYRSIRKDLLEQYLHQAIYQLMYQVIEEKAAGMRISEEHKKFIAHFYKYAFVGIVLDWVDSGMKVNPQKIVDDVALLIQDEFLDALEKFRYDKPHT